MATRISKNFTLDEMTASKTAKLKGIINAPGVDEVCNMCALVHHVLQPLRDAMGEQVKIGSGYRCTRLNQAVGGVTNSQHIRGEAADLCIDGDKAKGKRWFDWITVHCEFDQLIWEHNAKGSYWIHVSYRSDGKNRLQVIDNLLKK
ncbi:MAG: peptidase M15 [Prevotella sp.]|nr:peptidase M15 [Prevotella sp.]